MPFCCDLELTRAATPPPYVRSRASYLLIVQLTLADGTKYDLQLPHCLAATNASGEPLCRSDIVVVTAPHTTRATWSYVDAADFDLVEHAEGSDLPAVVVRATSPGVFAVYSRAEAVACQRVLCIAFVPVKVDGLGSNTSPEPATLRAP